jgi:hypothetical protein
MNTHTALHSCNVFTSKLDVSPDYKKLMVDTADSLNYSFSRPDQNRARTDRRIWEETSVYNNILQHICNSMYVFIRQSNNQQLNDYNISIDSAWIVKYQPDGSMHWHDHFPAYYSFIYYILNSPGSPILEFEGGLTFDGYQDHLIVFPGYLKHQVIYRQSSDPRLALVGNAQLVLNS